MADTPLEKARARRKTQYKTDFDPDHAETPPAAPDRIATALEYMAFQLGEINRKLDKIVAASGSKS
jgi:hypothetical protein